MANLLEQGAAWLAAQLQAHASTRIEYQRDNDAVTLQAIIGRTEFEIDDGSGVLQRIESRDYLIPAGDLRLGGVQTLPVVGDRIRETQGGRTFVCEVLAPGKEPHYRYSDPFRTLLRIHTKLVARE